MRAVRTQTCVQYYISNVAAQTAGLIETQIGINTHWGNRHNVRVSAIASAHSCARKRARSTTYPALAPNGLTDRDPNSYKHSLRQSTQVIGVCACNYGGAVVPRKREPEEQAQSERVREWNMAAQPPRA
jgi:hypothetical protein